MAKQKEDEDRKRAEEERLRRQAKEKQEREEAQRKIEEIARAPSPVPVPVPAASPSPTPPVQPAAATTYLVSPAALAATFKHILLTEEVEGKGWFRSANHLPPCSTYRRSVKRVQFAPVQNTEQLDAAEENGEHLYEVDPETHSTEPEDLYQTPDENTAAVAAAGEPPSLTFSYVFVVQGSANFDLPSVQREASDG